MSEIAHVGIKDPLSAHVYKRVMSISKHATAALGFTSALITILGLLGYRSQTLMYPS